MVVHCCDPGTGEDEAGAQVPEASLDYIVRSRPDWAGARPYLHKTKVAEATLIPFPREEPQKMHDTYNLVKYIPMLFASFYKH